LHNLWQVYANLEQGSLVEAYHELQHWMNEAQGMFSHGVLTLAQRAGAEQIYFTALQRLSCLLSGNTRQQREILDFIHDSLADKYFCNFSLFQSLPDAWAIDQVFPVMPLQRLHERPTRRGIIDDITCDSDGRIDQYVDSEGIESSLPLHPLRKNEAYYLAFFLVGAYQEILGDMHNLFGDTDSVNVTMDGDAYKLEQPMKGDGVDAVLRYVHFDADELRNRLSDKLLAVDLTDGQRDEYQEELFAGLQGYTYLED
jgi:arginine decarboxylase